jgi:hypothetical protein
MATITEDYVSFETAKLLKEKGFDVYGDGSFGSETKIWMEYSPFGKIRDVSSSRPSIKGYPAPTLQMARKWLREVHNIDIEIHTVRHLHNKWYSWFVTSDKHVGTNNKREEKYEEACEAAIKYCLENLI